MAFPSHLPNLKCTNFDHFKDLKFSHFAMLPHFPRNFKMIFSHLFPMGSVIWEILILFSFPKEILILFSFPSEFLIPIYSLNVLGDLFPMHLVECGYKKCLYGKSLGLHTLSSQSLPSFSFSPSPPFQISLGSPFLLVQIYKFGSLPIHLQGSHVQYYAARIELESSP